MNISLLREIGIQKNKKHKKYIPFNIPIQKIK